MKAFGLEQWAQGQLRAADIALNGSRPWDIVVHDPRLYGRVMRSGSLGLGEAYEEGWWDCERLDEFFTRLLQAHVHPSVFARIRIAGHAAAMRLFNPQSIRRSRIVGERHYDLGNDLYRAMLDSRMIYSCAYWAHNPRDLDEAQEHKLRLICRKLRLERGQRVLDIGCGWGGLAAFMAKRHNVSVVGLTVSKEQAALARERCAGLPVEIRFADYREMSVEQFDRVVSVGMFEHVGPKNYPTYFDVTSKMLKDGGLSLLHTIGGSGFGDPWIDKYIFPGGVLPRREQVVRSVEGTFDILDWHSFGHDYDTTLMAWHANFEAAWDTLKGSAYDERFRRRWRYYLLMCAGAFRAGRTDLWQVLLGKGATGTYPPIR